MAFVIGYGDTKKEGTFFLGKEPNPETPNLLEWVSFLSAAFKFESQESAQSVIDDSMHDYDEVYVLPVKMKERGNESKGNIERG